MRSSDLTVGCIFLVAGCGLGAFASVTQSDGRSYFIALVVVLLAADLFMLGRGLVRLLITRKFYNECFDLWNGFQLKQFVFLLGSSVLYAFGAYLFGFYLAGLVYAFAVIHHFKGVAKWERGTLILLLPVIYLITTALNRPLPAGEITGYLFKCVEWQFGG